MLFFFALFHMLEILRFFKSHGHYRNFIYNVECISSFLAVTGKKIEGLHTGVRKHYVPHTAISFLRSKNGENFSLKLFWSC